ncbi:MAG TPA: hypothetical protein VH079_14725 [Terriglobales bacterium]|jgi:hypothetical protein|nr:hypothetical protein [Terriglobales bacterium]
MKIKFTQVSLGFMLLAASSSLSAQADPASGSGSGSMIAPAPVTGEGYSLDFASEQPRTNTLRGGVDIGAAYGNGVAPSGASDVSYQVSPNISFNQTRSRFSWDLSYSPGFTFYQKYSALNQSNQNVASKFSYRLSPHVTFSADESFTKSVGGYLQACQNLSTSCSGGIQSPNNSILAPNTDTITDASSARLTYQFSPGGMVGLSGSFSELSYPHQSQVPGLNNSNSAGGSAFYTHRISGKHYIGATYEYQKYLNHPDGLATLAQSVMLFYTFYIQRSISFSIFGGPQYSDSYGPLPIPTIRSWSPGGGASLNWQGQHNSLIGSYSRKISDGGGLQGAVSYNGVDASIRHQFAAALSGTIGADYSVNKVLDAGAIDNTSGHSISGTATLQRQLGQHFNLMAGYLRLHQSYDIQAINTVPNRNRVWVSIGYQFQRSLGR